MSSEDEYFEDERDEIERDVDAGLEPELASLRELEKDPKTASVARLALVVSKPFRLWLAREVDEKNASGGSIAISMGKVFGNLLASAANMSSDPTAFANIAGEHMMGVFTARLKPKKIIKPPSSIILP